MSPSFRTLVQVSGGFVKVHVEEEFLVWLGLDESLQRVLESVLIVADEPSLQHVQHVGRLRAR